MAKTPHCSNRDTGHSPPSDPITRNRVWRGDHELLATVVLTTCLVELSASLDSKEHFLYIHSTTLYIWRVSTHYHYTVCAIKFCKWTIF